MILFRLIGLLDLIWFWMMFIPVALVVGAGYGVFSLVKSIGHPAREGRRS